MSATGAHLLTLADGRTLSFGEDGDPAGRPVLFFPGAPGSRLPVVLGQGAAAAAAGIRLLSIERPGFGESTRHEARTLAGWPDDVTALADALGLDRFALIGLSAGGPHVLACAALLGARVTHAVVVGCGAPWDSPEVTRDMDWPRRALRLMAMRAPWLLRLTYRSLPDPRKHPDRLTRQMLAGLSAPDQALLARPEIFRMASDGNAAALAHGFDGMADEVLLLARPRGFDLASIAVPVEIFCGTEDTAAPLRQSEYLAARIPHARLHRIGGEGHLCIMDHWPELLAAATA